MKVRPSPAREPYRAACVVERKYVTTKPRNWKKKEVKRLKVKTRTLPAGRSSIIISPESEGATTVVSQYGGTASAWASV